MSKEGKRRRPYQRPRKPKPMREGDNDRRIVQLVYHYRILSQKQLERLMGRSPSTLQRLLRRLYDHRYLDRVFLPVTTLGSSPALYILDKKGQELLHRMGIEMMSNPPSSSLSAMFLEHTLAINSFRIAVEQACQTQGWTVERWLSDHDLKRDYDRVKIPGKKRAVSLIPDAYFCIHVPERGHGHFFLELDRGTMTTDRYADKVRAYISYYKSGQYERRYRAKGFRVLTVIDGIGVRRIQNLLQASENLARIGKRFWFAHINEINSQTVLSNAIWQVSGENNKQRLI